MVKHDETKKNSPAPSILPLCHPQSSWQTSHKGHYNPPVLMITNIHQIIREMKPMLMMDDGRALTESECGDKTPTVTFHPIILSIPCLLFGLNESVQLSYKGFLEFKVVQPDVETIKLL